jgi:YidC/Oxa1 family membrane protein insertase
MDFLNPLFDAIGWLLALFYSVIPNLGISIILLTFTIMLILYPLTAKQAKSMIAMQRVQPEIKKLQAKYKGDRQKLNEEMMKFYQENKINPLAGCLPLLAQLPVFFSLFRVLRDPEKYVPADSDLYADLCHKADGALKTLKACAESVNHLKFLGMDLQLSATDAHSSALNAAPYFFLVGLVILTGFMQTRQAQKRTPVANKQMGAVMRVLPIFFGLISLQFPSGLVLYFFVSNLWRLGQQEVIFRRHGSALHPPRKEVGGKGTKVIEAESRVVEADDGEIDEEPEPEAPKPILPAKKPKPEVQVETHEAQAQAPARPAKTSGLRGLFQLPPPPEPNGGGSGTAPRSGSNGGSAGARSGGSSSGGGARSQPQRSRNRKKKKKR